MRTGLRARVKRFLALAGLLEPVETVRNSLWEVRFRKANARFLRQGAPDGQPIPPLDLRVLVAASPDIGWFLESGRRGAESIRAALARQGREMETLGSILDFGCGCGRVTRHWAALPAAVYGCDVNERLVSWCRANLRFGRFATNALVPPLDYADGAFDLVHALSVFTHLTEDLQRAWMRELRRVVHKDGFVLFTTHGVRYLEELLPEERASFLKGDLVLRRDDRPGSNACGSYHPEAWVRRHLADGFEVADFVPEGALGNPWQDLWLLRRRS